MGKTFLYFILGIVWTQLFCASAAAQQFSQNINISTSPNAVGSGARAMGMGGAFIAVADDATAASWNPAGLSQLKKPEFSFAFSYFNRREGYSSSSHREAEGMQKADNRELNYFSIACPFVMFERNMIVSLNYQRLYDFERDVNLNFQSEPSGGLGQDSFSQNIDFRQYGGLKAISPAFAVEITPSFSLGVTLNIWTDKLFWSNGWESDNIVDLTISQAGSNDINTRVVEHDRYHDFKGVNMHLGFLWRPNSFLTIGGVVKTPFKAKARHEKRINTTIDVSGGGTSSESPLYFKENVDLEMPLSYGIGAALRFSDRLTVSMDVFRTEWSKFILEDGSGRRMSPVTGKLSHETDVKATNQVRLGMEYLFVLTRAVIPLRLGLFYDPEPSEKNPQDFWGFSVGTGFSAGKTVVDLAYQFRFGSNVQGALLGVPETDVDVKQHLFLLSVIYHF